MFETREQNYPPGRTLERITLKDQVKSQLKADILTGAYDNGDVFNTSTIAKNLGVSLTPVREALIELQSEGLIDILPSVGFRVVKPSKEDLINVLELRELLEIYSNGKIAGNVSQEDLAKARYLSANTRKCAERGDLAGYLEADRNFHVYLVSIAGNQRITRIIDELRQATRMPALRRLAESGSLTNRVLEHDEILSAIENGQKDKVVELTRKHIGLTRKELIGSD